MKVFYFTGTGNSLFLAERICEAAGGGDLVSIAAFLRECGETGQKDGESGDGKAIGWRKDVLIEDEAVGIVFPVYWVSVPAPVVKFLRQIRIESPYIFAVPTFGGFGLPVHDHLRELAREQKFHFSLIAGCKMPDNFVPWYDLGKQNRRFPQGKIAARADRAAELVAARHVGGTGATILRPLLPLAKRYSTKNASDFDTRYFRVEAACTGCGLCAMACPAGNIRMEGGSASDSRSRPAFCGMCWCCLACTNVCPQNAIRCEGEKSKARYVNPFVGAQGLLAQKAPHGVAAFETVEAHRTTPTTESLPCA
ncbi:MAG: EFR1 family ferrodoxin [Clostridiales Family XIII bacterium]|jgi:formate hydrogenlyase subunit 6/NADH:ubiquinone oxidoreductase subunit I|nr:EFR1 family ferrodoxin [Clostridiales Family XIII bacterium]